MPCKNRSAYVRLEYCSRYSRRKEMRLTSFTDMAVIFVWKGRMNLKRIITFLLVAIMITSVLIAPAFAYNRNDAVTYANKYAKTHNPTYKYFWAKGNCANFVSQCLSAGGLNHTTKWHYYTSSHQYTSAWTVANDLKNYIKNDIGGSILAPKWKKVAIPSQRTYAYVDDSSNITSTDGGRVVVFYD